MSNEAEETAKETSVWPVLIRYHLCRVKLFPSKKMIEDSVLNISGFYVGKTVFITGATGFLGQIMLEKLLRSCPGIKTIYILIREKKDKQMSERIEELFSSELFQTVLKANPSAKEKVIGIRGDIAEPGLGMCSEDFSLVANTTDIVIHSAATVRFNEPLKKAVIINVLGTQRMLQLCQQMKNLIAIVHVSTAYSHSPRADIHEEFYPPPLSPEKAISLAELIDEDILNKITPTILKQWPNTYAFTKAVAETLVSEKGKQLPIAIVRPSIVCPSWREPILGWTNSLNGPLGLLVAAGKGLMMTVIGDPFAMANIIPVDVVSNLVIAVSCYIARHRPKDIPIFHSTVETEKTLTWQEVWDHFRSAFLNYPSATVYRYTEARMTNTEFWHRGSQICIDLPLVLLCDLYRRLRGKRPILLKIYEKIHKNIEVLKYFTTHEWNFTKSNSHMLEKLLSEEDKKIFNFSIRDLHWPSYWDNCAIASRKYLLKEEYYTLPEARRKLTRLYFVTQFMKLALAFGASRYMLYQSETAQHLWDITLSSIYDLMF